MMVLSSTNAPSHKEKRLLEKTSTIDGESIVEYDVDSLGVLKYDATPLQVTQIQHLKLSSSVPFPPRRILVIGGPSSGKDNVSSYVANKYNLVYISTGDMLRHFVAEHSLKRKDDDKNNSVAAIVQQSLDRDELVPDDIMIDLVRLRLQQADVKQHGYILDGFPRTRAQCDALSPPEVMPELVLCLKIPDQELVRRIVGQRMNLFPDVKSEEFVRNNYEISHKAAFTEEQMLYRLKGFHEDEALIKTAFSESIIEIDATGSCADTMRLVDQLTSGVAF